MHNFLSRTSLHRLFLYIFNVYNKMFHISITWNNASVDTTNLINESIQVFAG